MDFWKSFVLIVLGIMIGIGAVGVGELLFVQPRGEAIKILPTNTPAPVVVYINGEIRKPGVYSLTEGSRLIDLVRVAGGFKDSADPTSIDLASFLKDGENFYIPHADEALSPSSFPELVISQDGLADENSQVMEVTLNLNQATKSELENLPGIGPTLAQRILDYREEYGDFYDVKELASVPGISESLMNELAAYVTVK